MKLAISNLAWDASHDSAVAALMQSHGVTGVELAPTKIWDEPLDASNSEIGEYVNFWSDFGIRIVSLQSLLFNKPDLQLFLSDESRLEMQRYLAGIIELASKLGAQILVFGSPKNRTRGDLDSATAEKIAVPFFRAIGEVAQQCGVIFCIEPNPVEYGCDWITTSTEGARLVESVRSPGFGLHLDAAGMTLSGEDPATAIPLAIKATRHFHISEPNLKPVGSSPNPGTNHSAFANALNKSRFEGWTSIEMLPPPSALEGIEQALSFASVTYTS
jgi:sugar phosphate isomerase/epimerase